MNRLLISLLLVIQACTTTSRTSESVQRMHSCYEQAVEFENSDFCFKQSEFTQLHRQANKMRGRDFWKAFSDYRQELGPAKANSALKSIVEQRGLSMALLVPINNDLRGMEVDRIIDAMLLANHKKTRLLVEQVGQPADLQLANQARGITSQ